MLITASDQERLYVEGSRRSSLAINWEVQNRVLIAQRHDMKITTTQHGCLKSAFISMRTNVATFRPEKDVPTNGPSSEVGAGEITITPLTDIHGGHVSPGRSSR